jgi:hypothetical protein
LTNNYEGPGDYFSLAVGALLVILILAAFFMPIYLVYNKHLIADERFKEKFQEMYEGIKRNHNSIIIYPSLYFFRRFGFLALVLVAADYSGLQITGFLILSLFNLYYLTYIDPYKSVKRFYIEIFNEVCHVLASYILYGFTDFNSNAT